MFVVGLSVVGQCLVASSSECFFQDFQDGRRLLDLAAWAVGPAACPKHAMIR